MTGFVGFEPKLRKVDMPTETPWNNLSIEEKIGHYEGVVKLMERAKELIPGHARQQRLNKVIQEVNARISKLRLIVQQTQTPATVEPPPFLKCGHRADRMRYDLVMFQGFNSQYICVLQDRERAQEWMVAFWDHVKDVFTVQQYLHTYEEAKALFNSVIAEQTIGKS